MTVVGTVADFPDGTHRIVTVDGREVGVFNIGGRLYGLANRCAHQGGPLCAARRTTGTLVADADSGWQPRWTLDGEVEDVARAIAFFAGDDSRFVTGQTLLVDGGWMRG